MKKTYIAVRQVREFIAGQSPECQAEYQNIVDRLEHDGYLVEPRAKKVGAACLRSVARTGPGSARGTVDQAR